MLAFVRTAKTVDGATLEPPAMRRASARSPSPFAGRRRGRGRREAPGRSRRGARRRPRWRPVTDHSRPRTAWHHYHAERNLAEEIDQVVTRTLAQSWDNADARNRGVRRATAAIFRRYALKPVGEPYDSTIAYIEAHYLVE
jgi:hypothetical protein